MATHVNSQQPNSFQKLIIRKYHAIIPSSLSTRILGSTKVWHRITPHAKIAVSQSPLESLGATLLQLIFCVSKSKSSTGLKTVTLKCRQTSTRIFDVFEADETDRSFSIFLVEAQCFKAGAILEHSFNLIPGVTQRKAHSE
mmetsp:Transcript_7992/g.19583  ORF Transcript_7992/g.19583 Transcript_7992/m.19583 type:complete len:141 (-) Transcript_7992:672-1094(-)